MDWRGLHEDPILAEELVTWWLPGEGESIFLRGAAGGAAYAPRMPQHPCVHEDMESQADMELGGGLDRESGGEKRRGARYNQNTWNPNNHSNYGLKTDNLDFFFQMKKMCGK